MKNDGFSVEMTFCLEIWKKNTLQILRNKPKRQGVLTAFLLLFQSRLKSSTGKGGGKKKRKGYYHGHVLLLTQAKFPLVQISRLPFSFQSDKEASTEVNEKASKVWVKIEKGLQDLR